MQDHKDFDFMWTDLPATLLFCASYMSAIKVSVGVATGRYTLCTQRGTFHVTGLDRAAETVLKV